MEYDLRRIDLEVDEALLEGNGAPPSPDTEAQTGLLPPAYAGSPTRADSPPAHADSPPNHTDLPPPIHADLPPPTLRQKEKIWVVFQGREPGIYDCMYVFRLDTTQIQTLMYVFQGPCFFSDSWI